MIYLDSAATTLQKPPCVAKAVQYSMNNLASPGRGGYKAAMSAANKVFSCRESAATMFGAVSPENVVFTSNATHGLNIAIKSLVRRGTRVVVSGYEHNAVTRPLYSVGADIVVASSPLFNQDAAMDAFETAIQGAEVVICNHVSNVFGFILPVEGIARLCKRRGVPFILDASQSAGVLPVNATELDAAFVAMPGHKSLYGPQGTGILICKAIPAATLLEGGTGSNSQSWEMPDFLPDRLEAGTHNVPGICGLLEGMKFVESKGDSILKHERELTEMAARGLLKIKKVKVFCGKHQTGVLSFTIDGIDCETVAELLGKAEIAVRAGLHCAPLAHKTACSEGTVRISTSAFNTANDISVFLQAVKRVASRHIDENVNSF